jgi:hypothetical protein
MAESSSLYLPSEKGTGLSLVAPAGREALTAQLIRGGPVGYDNGPVYAVVGDARTYGLQDRIMAIKGENRHGPLGTTVPFDEPLIAGIFRTSHLTSENDIAVREFLEDPDAQTRRLGGVAFLRSLADHSIRATLPKSMFSEPAKDGNEEGITAQLYSPVGNGITDSLLRRVIALGGIPVMTSLNEHGKPEIINEADARQFAADKGVQIVINSSEAANTARLLRCYRYPP